MNAIIDDTSDETFLKKEVASYIGLQQPFVKVQVNVLNSAMETFQSMPVKVDILNANGHFRRTIEASPS